MKVYFHILVSECSLYRRYLWNWQGAKIYIRDIFMEIYKKYENHINCIRS